MNAPKHTPWLIGDPTPLRPTYTIFNKPFGLGDICEVADESHARLIVEAVNSYATLRAANAAMKSEMRRFAPVLSRLEDTPLWTDFTAGLGIATLNGYYAAMQEPK